MSMRNEIVRKKENVAEAIQRLEQYHIRIEQSPGLIYEGEIDRVGKRQYVKTHGEGFPEAEMLWVGEEGFGRRLGADTWFKLRGKPFPDYLKSAMDLIDENLITSEREEDQFLVVEIAVDLNSEPKDAYRKLFNAIFKMLKVKNDDFVKKIVELSQKLSLVISLRISKEDFLVKEIKTQVMNLPFDAQCNVTFDESQWEIPRLSAKERRAATVEIPTSVLLFLQVPRIGGWCLNSHKHWAMRSIEHIKTKDTYKNYSEIYDPYWLKPYKDDTSKIKQDSHHPIVIGAYYEDEMELGKHEGKNSFYHEWFYSDPNYSPQSPYYFTNDKYLRDHHHYGGENKGLQYQWYFLFRFLKEGVKMSTTQPGERYYSAKNWGYGGNKVAPNLNRLTFTEAIKQYNRYSLDGKRCAYLMLGHVLHLLQDQGQPDHAALVSHAASANNEPEAYEKFKTCYILAAEIVGILSPDLVIHALSGDIGTIIAKAGILAPIFFIALGSCMLSVDPDEVGYERLIKDKFDYNQKTNKLVLKKGKIIPKPIEAEKEIELTDPLYGDTYNDFFKQMALKSIAARNDIKSQYPNEDLLDYPLGLGPLPIIVPQIPGCNPDIDSTDANQTDPFFKLTNKVVKNIICYGAGFVQRFYEIVNHPPYVERVSVVKAVPGLKPVAFAKFDSSFYLPECKKCQVRYSGEWSHQPGTSTRTLSVQSEPLSPDHRAYIFVQFGPNLGPGKSKRVRLETLKVKLIGKSPTNKPINIPVQLTAAKNPQSGWYYWGSFQPSNPWGKNYKLTLEIQAKDTSAHFKERTHPGDELDSHPETTATVDPNNSPLYPFINYKPGVDRNHKIEIATPIVADKWEENQTILDPTPVNLGISTASLINPDFKSEQNPDNGAVFFPCTGKNALTLHSPTDVDFFHVHFRTSPNDKNMQGGMLRAFGGGLYLESFAPRLEIRVQEAFGGCLNMQLYDSQTAQKLVYHNTKDASIDRPQDIFTGNNFYLAVRNPDYAKQGKLRYGLFIRYTGGGFIVKGRLLYKFWEHTGFPWPPPQDEFWEVPWEVIWGPRQFPEKIKCYDLHQFISDLEGFLPELVNELRIEDRVERNIMLANERYELGQIAQSVGLLADAELLYNESINVFRRHKIVNREADVLHDLQAIYAVQGRLNEAAQINLRLDELR